MNVPQVSWHHASNIQSQEGAAWALARRDAVHEVVLGLFTPGWLWPGVQGIFSVSPCICQSRMHTGSVCHSNHKSISHIICPWWFWKLQERIAFSCSILHWHVSYVIIFLSDRNLANDLYQSLLCSVCQKAPYILTEESRNLANWS